MKNVLSKLVEKLKEEFEIPENINHYSKKDYNSARRKYVLFELGRLHNNKEK